MRLEKDLYFLLHKELIAKAIEELSFEHILEPTKEEDSFFSLGVSPECYYLFQAKLGAWDNLQMSASSLRKFDHGKEVFSFTMNTFFQEIQDLCQMSDQTLAQFLEEGNQTLYCEYIRRQEVDKLDVKALLDQKFCDIDQLLLGHPKLIMNRGRIGWGGSHIQEFSPETKAQFQLRWLAVKKDLLDRGTINGLDRRSIYTDSLTSDEIDLIEQKILKDSLENYHLLPVHPWQWDKYIMIQYAEYFARQEMVDLGPLGKVYTPQSSLRTLSAKEISNYDIKVSLSILNTSCVRGIPGKYIETGAMISESVVSIINDDSFLKDKVIALQELYALRVKNLYFDHLPKASYRYKELLGAVWRESVEARLKEDETAIPTAALFFKNPRSSFIKELIKLSGLSPKEWIRKYFETVVIPLYHLQLHHGLGLVSHGQNTILIHKKGIPEKLIIKDFHGDLRIANDSPRLFSKAGFDKLDRLPYEYLIHDLYTGHFITVLRYVSRILEDEELLKEKTFYQILGHVVENYHHSQKDIPESMNLLREHFERVLVNKVRFIAGYDETSERLRPILGKNIINPLVKFSQVVHER